MWLSKLFGGRKRHTNIDLGEEPARYSAPTPQDTTGSHLNIKRRMQAQTPPQNSGFDPYNSGAFKKKNNAWERVGRR